MYLTSLAASTAIHLPLEILDKIAFDAKDDYDTLLAASLVSKVWRAASLRYVFDRANFGMKHDFEHWQAVTVALPEVINYVRDITFAPGVLFYAQSMAHFWERAESFDESKLKAALAEAASEYFKSLVDIALPPDIPLPIMPRAKTLTWTTEFTQRMGKDMQTLTPATFRFLQSFPAVEALIINDEIPGEHVHDILCHFLVLKSFTWTRASVGRQLPGRRGFTSQFAGALSHLEVLVLSDPGAMVNPDPGYHYDWLVDMALAGNAPAPLREVLIRLEQPFPFSVTAFARLLSAVASTLRTLDILLNSSLGACTHAHLETRSYIFCCLRRGILESATFADRRRGLPFAKQDQIGVPHGRLAGPRSRAPMADDCASQYLKHAQPHPDHHCVYYRPFRRRPLHHP